MRRKFQIMNLPLLVLTVFLAGCVKPEPPTPVDPPTPGPVDPPTPEFKEEPNDQAKDPVLTYDYSILAQKKHPRVLMDQEGFDDLKVKVTAGRFDNKTLYKVHKLVLDLADQYCEDATNIVYKLDASNKRLLEQSNLALKRLFACSYAYKLTGKSKYFQKAQSDMKTVCSFSDWHPSHYLDVGEMALGVAIAYDWLYYDLSYEDRVRARRALSQYGLATSGSQSFHNTIGNWNQVCNAGIMAAAVAVYEKDKLNAVNAIEKGITGNRKAVEGIYSPDGNYAEGYDYWGYGTGFQAIIMQLLKSAFGNTAGIEDIPGFKQTGEYMLFMAGPVGKDFSYSDGGVGNERPKIGMWYFAALENNPSLLLNELRMMAADKYVGSSEIRLLPMVPLMVKDVNLDGDAKTPSKEFWYGAGENPIGMVHTGWEFNENDFYLGIKGGKADNGHGHMDAGSFVYDAYGYRWSADLARPSYSAAENALSAAGGNFWSLAQKSLRWDMYRMNNLSHSTISCYNNDGSVSGKVHPSDHYVSGKAIIEQYYDTPDRMGLKLNMNAPLKGQVASASRTVTLENRKDLKVVDVITAQAGKDAIVEWRMMSPSSAAVDASCITLTQKTQTMYLYATSSDASVQLEYKIWDPVRPADWTARSWDPGISGHKVVGYRLTIPAGKTVTLTTVLSATKN